MKVTLELELDEGAVMLVDKDLGGLEFDLMYATARYEDRRVIAVTVHSAPDREFRLELV